MVVVVETRIIIDRPPTEVAEYSANPDNAPIWYVNIKSINWRTPKPLAVGSQVDFVARFLGRRLAYTYEVVAMDLPHRLSMRTAQGPFPMQTDYEWRPASGGTEMVLRNSGQPRGFSRIAAPLMEPAMRKANMADLKNLKRILEAA